MTTDRKAELAAMCRLEIQKTVTLAARSLRDYGYHLAMSVFDAEFQSMLDRCSDKPFDEHDTPLLMEIVMEDLWPRLRKSNAEARGYMWKYVAEKSSTTTVSDAEFSMDTGWAALVNDAAERVATYPAEWKTMIVGGKEKFGCLVLHIACDYDQPGCRSEVERLREEIRLRSLSTCDICGGQGRLRLGSYAKTVCDKHAAIFEGFREDDGVHADPWRWNDEQPLEDHIADVIATGREIMADPWILSVGAVDVSLLKGMDPPLKRGDVVAVEEMDESNDPLRVTELGRRIDGDIWSRKGRAQELLIEFAYYIEAAVNGAVVKPEYLDDYISKELSGWSTYARVPLSESDRDWLHRYISELIREEYERVKGK